jgi:hypothetical protein
MSMHAGDFVVVAGGWNRGAESSDPKIVSISMFNVGTEPEYSANAVAAGTCTLTIYSGSIGQPPVKSFVNVTVTA